LKFGEENYLVSEADEPYKAEDGVCDSHKADSLKTVY